MEVIDALKGIHGRRNDGRKATARGKREAVRPRLCRWLFLLLVAAYVGPASAQVPSEGLTGARVAAVRVELAPRPPDPQVARNLEGAVRKAFRIYPGDRYDQTRLEFGLSRVRGVPGVSGAEARVEFADVGGLDLVVVA
jgi:hypothetical protein